MRTSTIFLITFLSCSFAICAGTDAEVSKNQSKGCDECPVMPLSFDFALGTAGASGAGILTNALFFYHSSQNGHRQVNNYSRGGVIVFVLALGYPIYTLLDPSSVKQCGDNNDYESGDCEFCVTPAWWHTSGDVALGIGAGGLITVKFLEWFGTGLDGWFTVPAQRVKQLSELLLFGGALSHFIPRLVYKCEMFTPSKSSS